MRHLVVCCDGTWQSTTRQSNTGRLADATAPVAGDGTPQRSEYIPGVGTTVGTRLLGGLTGFGLSGNVTRGYRWLAQQYEPGDRIWLFGFSRGAYTARSLAGMIGSCGLVDGHGTADEQLEPVVARVYRCYRAQPTPEPGWDDGLAFRYRPGDAEIPIWFIGVWDTVGALGIPSHLGPGLIAPLRHRYEFHNVRLDPLIPHARHGVAIDEMRGPFSPTLWRDPTPGQDVQQVWLPGDHLDVGGGHGDPSLSDGALLWMMDEASALGLAFDKERRDAVRPNPAGRQTAQPFWSRIAEPITTLAFAPRPRAVPRIDPERVTGEVHDSAYERQRLIGYRPTRTLEAGADQLVDIPDAQQWNETGLYLEPGDHTVTAEARPPAGLLRRLMGGTGGLEGVVANETTNVHGAVDQPHERTAISAGETTPLHVSRPGYLYARAADHLPIGRGEVRFTITRP